MGDTGTTTNAPVRLLIINPNTSVTMTEALKPVVEKLGYSPIEYEYFTCPSPGIPSINSPNDAAESATLCLPHLLPLLPHHDAFLVACYSHHPLVQLLKSECAKLAGTGVPKFVIGIFEASVTTSLSLVDSSSGFGIVSTGKVWQAALREAVDDFLGAGASVKFAGCETTGLNASELHELPADDVRTKMMQATRRLLVAGDASNSQPVKAICLGCAGMVGLDDAVRQACIDELGHDRGKRVHIVDGVKAGVGILFALAIAGF